MIGMYKEILDELPSGVWATDSEDNIMYMNKAMTSIAGASIEEFTGLNVLKDLDKPGNKEFLESYRKVKRNLFPGEYEVRLKDSKGKGFVHRGWLTPLLKNGIYGGMIVTAEDITEKDIYLKAVKESEDKFRRTIEFAADGILLGSNEGYITEANQAACELFGMNKEEMLQLHISKMPFTKDSLERSPMRFDLLKQGKTVISERVIKRKDRSEIMIEMKTKMMDDGSYQSIYRDITEKKKNEEKLKKFNQILEQKIKERTAELESFSYSVSHDLRAPLRHIYGFADILNKNIQSGKTDNLEQTLLKISSSAGKMERLIDDLLKLSRTSRQELNYSSVDFKILINEIISCDNHRGIKWSISELPRIRTDKNLIGIVWQNLIDNAIKYSSKNSDPKIEIGSRTANKATEFFIKDNGIGFEQDQAEKIFSPFSRLHLEKDFPGSGIGLAIVSSIIKRLGGIIRAEGDPGNGAAFYFTLPCEIKEVR
ncbi:MAG: PAS domain S-box protein [Candidatus Delongbacteria bacterium]